MRTYSLCSGLLRFGLTFNVFGDILQAVLPLYREIFYGEQELEQRGEIAVEDLEKSLDQWISYLSDANEPYPVWFRYYVFRNILDDFDSIITFLCI